MCFSAPVSFVSGAVLSVIGVSSVKKAKKRYALFAAIPLFFGIQQALEGVQWIANKPSSLSFYVAYGFLFFAFMFWPLYIPFASYVIETNEKRKKELFIYVLLGIIFFVGGLLVLLNNDLEIYVQNLHIIYDISIPYNKIILTLIYIALVAGVPMRSTKKDIRFFGFAILLGAIVSQVFFTVAFISVWCFLAALISTHIYWAVSKYPFVKSI